MTKRFAERSALMRKAAFGGFIDLSVCEAGTAQRERSAVGSSAQRPAWRTRPSAVRQATLRGAGSEGRQRAQAAQRRQRTGRHNAGSKCRQRNAGSAAQSTRAHSSSTAQHEAAGSAWREQPREAPRGFRDTNNSCLHFPAAEADVRSSTDDCPFLQADE